MAKLDFSSTSNAMAARRNLYAAAKKSAGSTVLNVAADKIRENPLNEGIPMEGIEDLAKSIEKNGLLDPLAVYEMPDDTYELVSGHRRFHAMTDVLKWKMVPCITIKYNDDEITRFMVHADANTKTRNKSIRYWIAEIKHAREVLADSGFEGTKEEETVKIEEWLGISKAQIYRLTGIAGMDPSVLELDRYGLSAKAMYEAVSLTKEQQKRAAEEAEKAAEESDDGQLTASMFSSIVKKVQQEEEKDEKPRKIRSYREKLTGSASSFLKKLSSAKNAEDKTAALDTIRVLRSELDELEASLSEK